MTLQPHFESTQREDGMWSVTARSEGKAGWALRKTESEAKNIATQRLEMQLKGEWW